jgi:hypothetical protein
VQDLQYVVTDGASFVDLERDATTQAVSMPDEKALEYTITNTAMRPPWAMRPTSNVLIPAGSMLPHEADGIDRGGRTVIAEVYLEVQVRTGGVPGDPTMPMTCPTTTDCPSWTNEWVSR